MQGFYKKDELERLIQRRDSRKVLGQTLINREIVERYYQERAIRRIGETFEKDNERKALCVMATGAGKTRTVIALCDLMMRCNWIKRVLFLADRVALVSQAQRAFTRHLPSAGAGDVCIRKYSRFGETIAGSIPSPGTKVPLLVRFQGGQPGHPD